MRNPQRVGHVLRGTPRSWLLILLACTGLALAAGPASGATSGGGAAPAALTRHRPAPPAGATPGIDPAFIYSQLDYMVTRFQHREAGYRSGSAGHTGFARYWAESMLRLLGPFGAQARTYQFPVRGWLGRPATAPAADVEVTVPGLSSPAEEVVMGCHYDAEADSTQSAYDDASGCAIELGVAKAMAAFWTEHHVYPARTLRFVLFDAEEQGLFGSFAYVSRIARNDLPRITAMINEEQNGIAYPLRYLGMLTNPLMPFFAYLSPLSSNRIYPRRVVARQQRSGLIQLRTLVRRAVDASFLGFRAMGDQMMTYHRLTGPDVWRPIFTRQQIRNVRVRDDTLGSSDQVPFTMAGVRSAMFVGNATYYEPHSPAGSYPYDRPQDTIALMNTFADGRSAASHALELALGLPGMLTTWLLSQPAVLGQVRPDGRPAAALADIGVLLPGHRVLFSAAAAYDPGRPAATLRYTWDFGDGRSGHGRSVSHVYPSRGTYTLRLFVTARHGRPRMISVPVLVAPQAPIQNPYAQLHQAPAGSIGALVAKGLPPPNPAVTLPVPAAGRGDRVGTAAQVRRLAARAEGRRSAGTGPSALPWALGSLCAVVLLVGLALAARWNRQRHAAKGRP
jgi:Peptidase family M28/PKD domain